MSIFIDILKMGYALDFKLKVKPFPKTQRKFSITLSKYV